MASHRNVLERSSNQFLSPAKVFAKLKASVQRDNEAVGETHRAAGCWKEDELKDNHRFALDAEALTLSPIKSPQKNVDDLHLNLSRSAVSEMTLGHVTRDALRHGHTPTKRHLMESTAVFHPLLPAPHRESVALRTPVKNQRGFEGCAPLDTPLAPSAVISPMAKRLRSRHTPQQQLHRVTSTSESPKTTSSAGRDDVTAMEELAVRGCSFPADTDRISYQRRTAQLRTEMKCCSVSIHRLMSPAKMFAYMKQRENRRQQQDVQSVGRHTEELSEGRDSPPLSAAEEVEDNVSWTASESPGSVPAARLESTDGRSSMDAAPSPQLVLLEDTIFLNTPRISIPKKHKAMFKPNQLPQRSTFPSESVIHLKEWFLRQTRKGLFVDGLRIDDNIPWNSNIIMERVSTSVLKTVSGRVYVLVGKMKLNVDTEFPQSLLKQFLNGFPPNWKELYEKFLSAPSGSRETQTTSQQKSSKTKKTPEAWGRYVGTVKTSDSCPPSSSFTKVSRSGRVIKPPLEYWKGGRVILDAQMNVTVFERYDTSICSPVLAPGSDCSVHQSLSSVTGARASQRQVSRSCSEGQKRQESTSGPAPRAPLRTVRASHRTPPEQRPPSSPVESRLTSSSDDGSDRKRPPAAASRSRTTRDRQGAAGRKRTVGSSTDNSRGSGCQWSVDEFPVKRKKRNAKVVRKFVESSQSEEEERGEQLKTARAKKHGSQTNGTQHKSSKPPKSSPRTDRPARKPTAVKDSTRSALEDEEWAEDELFKLQQAVSHHPRYIIKHRPHDNMQQTPPKNTNKTRKEKVDAPKASGTLRTTQQVRHFLDADMEDVFRCQQMERGEMPPSSRDQDSSLTSCDALTDTSRCLPCPRVSPGMMGSQSSKNHDIKYVFQPERRRKKAAAKSFTPSPSVKPTTRRCGNPENDTFVVREMFPEEVGVLDASGEEEDFYFS